MRKSWVGRGKFAIAIRRNHVGGDLRDHAREQPGDLGRGFAVGVGEPAVEGPDRRLDGEGDREAEEQPVVRAGVDLCEVECALLEPVDDDRRQHQERSRDGVDDELEGRAEPPGAAPHADQDVQRDQHRLEERVEDEQVLRGEDADHRAREEEQQAEVGSLPLAADPPGVGARRGAADDGQPDEPEREPEHADVVARVDVAEPRALLGELERAAPEVELAHRFDPEGHLHERDEGRQRGDPGASASAGATRPQRLRSAGRSGSW